MPTMGGMLFGLGAVALPALDAPRRAGFATLWRGATAGLPPFCFGEFPDLGFIGIQAVRHLARSTASFVTAIRKLGASAISGRAKLRGSSVTSQL